MYSPTDAAARALRWARVARVLSWLAGLGGLAFVSLFLAQAGFFAMLLPKDAAPPPVTNPDQISATSSTVTGKDRENQPYTVKAARGWQDEKVLSLVHLEKVEGTFRKKTGENYTLTADTGLYDTNVKNLDLAGNVTVVQKDRFTARMEKAHVVVEEKRLESASPVTVDMAAGRIEANGLQITNDGARILFLNGVRARFEGQASKGDQTP
jgi:lipopolysaccharide export system protein LptC